jgi:ribosome assembly protein 1
LITIHTPNKISTIKIRAVPLPSDVTEILEENGDLLKAIERESKRSLTHHQNVIETALTARTLDAISNMKQSLTKAFADSGDKQWLNAVDNIWSFGPRRGGPNILLNRIASYKKRSIWDNKLVEETTQHYKYDSSFVNGFQLASLAGPLCEEPMMGVCFVIDDWSFKDDDEDDSTTT